MKETQFTYCKKLLLKLLLLTALFCSVFTFSINTGISSTTLQKINTELFSPDIKVISKRVISYKYALRQIGLSAFDTFYTPKWANLTIAHNMLEKVKFYETLKNCYCIELFIRFTPTKTTSQTLDDEVFVLLG
ncbi:hypothetical protein [Flavobacterium cerinum]|uniref:Uncharacterized protein n=1 Tax=Flavobacterium cerinum TaxID=2502784 RepID=A0A3S3QA32_9FLAO|nr:hypothetical protein [Flavobacterium cerinum]RWX02246.1 hypothetical protein EPI11_03245 [Flavobacterium cerinum]